MGACISSTMEGGVLEDKERAKEFEFASVAVGSALPGSDYTRETEDSDSEEEEDDGPTLVVDKGEEGGRRRKKVKAKNNNNSNTSSAPTSAMENLKNVVLSMKKDALNRQKQHMHPSPEQLSSFVGKMAGVLKSLAGNAPASVKMIITAGFGMCGYELGQGKVVAPDHLTLHMLIEALKYIHTNLGAWVPSYLPTNEEVKDVRLAASRLWALDGNRLVRGTDYELNIQVEKSPHNHSDQAPDKLFSFVDEGVFERPTFKAFRSLLDNYTATLGVADSYTTVEKREMDTFIARIKETPCLQYAHAWLARNNKAPKDMDAFMAKVKAVWFDLYRRKTDNDSSGFEHVFLGERDADKKSISGLHNWIQVYMEEKAGNLDYKGKIKQRSNYEGNEEFLTIQFEWRGEEKFVSSSLIGTSPEFEMALLSMCFFNGKEDTAVTLGPHQNVNIKCYTIRRKGRTYVGSAYPEKGNNKR